MSDCATFDERVFPGNSSKIPDLVVNPISPNKVSYYEPRDYPVDQEGTDEPPPPNNQLPHPTPGLEHDDFLPDNLGPGPDEPHPLSDANPTSPSHSRSPSRSPSPPPIPPARHRRTELEMLGPPPDINGPHLRQLPMHYQENAYSENVESALQAGLRTIYNESDYLTLSEAFDFAHALIANEAKPQSYHEAMQCSNAAKWHKAACEEIDTLMENSIFELVQLPPGCKAIGSRWVFKIKRNANGSIERYKGRLVAKGCSQRPGWNFIETFAPTPKWIVLRAILAIASAEDLELESVDISSAFLHGEIDSEIYMQQPEGFVQ